MVQGKYRWELTTLSQTLVPVSGTGDLHNLTDGETSSFTFNFTLETLTVEDGKTYTVESGTTEIFESVTVEDGGTLNVNGTLFVTGDNPKQLGEYEQEADNFVRHTTENNNHKYSPNLPDDATVEGLIVEIQPSDTLTDNDVEGIYGVITDIEDERNSPLTNYDWAVTVWKLADISEYSDVNAAKSDLAV